MTQSQQPGYRFDGFRVDVGSRELIGADGGAVALTGKAFDVLLYLVERAQRVVSKDELLAQVWTGRVVDENNLTQAISALRKALGAGAGDHRYILTEARRGYRFVAAVEQSEGGSTGATSAALGPALDTPPPRHTAWLPWLGWLVLVIAFIAAALLATNALRERTRLAGTGKTATVATTLAVLPFRQLGSGANRSGDELLQLGMAETLIARLSRSTSMRVLSLGSVQGFIGPNVDTVRAARILGAHYVIEGSTQQRGNSVRVNARLLALPDGRTVWAGTYDQAPERVFTLQDSMAEAVIAALALQHITEPRRKRSACDGDDPKAYRAYLRGRYLIQRPSGARMPDALAAFRDAIALDPACTRAYAGMAWAYRGMVNGGDRDPRVMLPLAEASARQALKLDPDSADALVAYGLIQEAFHWDWDGAEVSLQRAIKLNPSLAEAHFVYAGHLVGLRRFDEALSHAHQAHELDPLSPLINTLEAGFLGAAHRPEAARGQLERALELEPGFWLALRLRGGMALDRGDPRVAIADLKLASERSRGNSQVAATLAIAYVAAGERAPAQAILRELQTRAADGYLPSTSLAAVRNALGDTEGALDSLERAYQEHDIRMSLLAVDARWNNLRTQPRFRALARRMRLEASARAYGRF